MSFELAVNRKAVEIGRLCLEMTTAAGSGHPSTGLSLAHLVTVLMYHQMRWDPKDPWNPSADRLVLSEGHAVPIVYAAYADLGGMVVWNGKDKRPLTPEDAMTLRAIDSPLDGHPHPRVGFPFADAATGSLGQGLSVAAGLGAAARLDGVDRNVYCLIGDGESREGQIWEAMDFLVDQALTNVIPIFNCNELAQSDWVSPQQSAEVLARKAEAFGFVVTVIDGHDPRQIANAFSKLHVIQNGMRPLCVIARTVKGWGVAAEQGTGKHGTAVKKDKLPEVLGQLERTAVELGVADVVSQPALHPTAPGESRSAKPEASGSIRLPGFGEAAAAVGLERNYASGKAIAPRKAYGAALLALAKADGRVIGLDADVKNSTYAEWLAEQRPGQFIECRIAEQNMVSVAAGLAAAGKIPFCSTFAKFFERAYDQIEMAIIGGANIKLTGSHAGVTLAADGPSQMSLPDVAYFRAFSHVSNFNGEPAVRYFFPADAVSCYRLTELMANLDGCCYQRALRADVPAVYKPEERFEVGGHKVLREGKDLCLVAAGYMVHECLRVADELGKSGRHATVIDAYCLPLKAEPILEMAMRSGGEIVTVEDNYAGGLEAELGGAIARAGAAVRLRSVFVRAIPKSGREPEDVLKHLHLDAGSILAAIGSA